MDESKESKLQTLTLYLACCPLNYLYVLNLPASIKAISKKVVGTIFSYMRKRKQERHIRSFLYEVRAEQQKPNAQPPHPLPTLPVAITKFSIYPFSTSRLPSSPPATIQYFRLLPPPLKKLPPPLIPPPLKKLPPPSDNCLPGEVTCRPLLSPDLHRPES